MRPAYISMQLRRKYDACTETIRSRENGCMFAESCDPCEHDLPGSLWQDLSIARTLLNNIGVL